MNETHCTLCPRKCGADRTVRTGFCGTADTVRVARAALHFGEEPCISGTRGSGTVFFSGCALKCRYCQNAPIRDGRIGKDVSSERLSQIFLELIDLGAHNINLVTPSHFAPYVAHSLRQVKDRITVPIVCNCSGYESQEILREFDGLVDVYLTDFKYFDPLRAKRYSAAEDYPAVAKNAILEMYRQTGSCRFDTDGMIQNGVMIRHLVLPNGKRDAESVLRWIAQNFAPQDVRISLMRQYTPCGDLSETPEINRSVFSVEYEHAVRIANQLGLIGFLQGHGCNTMEMTPDFDLTGV